MHDTCRDQSLYVDYVENGEFGRQPSSDVFCRRYRLHVIGVHARAISAKMIQLHPFTDRTFVVLVNTSIGTAIRVATLV
jgi:hypothetical protein